MNSRPWDIAEMKKYEHALDFEQEQNRRLRELWKGATGVQTEKKLRG